MQQSESLSNRASQDKETLLLSRDEDINSSELLVSEVTHEDFEDTLESKIQENKLEKAEKNSHTQDMQEDTAPQNYVVDIPS